MKFSKNYFRNIALKTRIFLEARVFIDKKIFDIFPNRSWSNFETKEHLREINDDDKLKAEFLMAYPRYKWNLMRCHFDILNESVHLIDNEGSTFNESCIVFNIKLDDLLLEVKFIKDLFFRKKYEIVAYRKQDKKM